MEKELVSPGIRKRLTKEMEEERLTRQVPLALNMLLYPFCASKQVIELEF